MASPPVRVIVCSMATFTATARSSADSLIQTVDVNGRHTIFTDEPEDLGGLDMAPTPHELLPAALASCVSTMIALYVQRKEWTIGDVRVDVTYDAESVPRRFGVNVQLPEGLSEDQVARLTRVAQTCPVARAFETGFTVDERIDVPALVA
jgi:putative redox protein